MLWRAVWPTVWFYLDIKKGGSIEPPIVGGFLVLAGVGRQSGRADFCRRQPLGAFQGRWSAFCSLSLLEGVL